MSDDAELMKRLLASSRIWRQYVAGPNTPTFSRGDGREFQEQFQAAADAIARLTAERDKARRDANIARYGQPDFAWSLHVAAMDELRAERDALAAEVARLQKALRPFADYADMRGFVPDDMIISAGSPMAKRQITMGDCRRARAVFEPQGPTG